MKYDQFYESLNSILSNDDWKDFDFSFYRRGEENILKPALIKLGFKDITFYTGERDSFGPLSRIVHCVDKDKRIRFFVYG